MRPARFLHSLLTCLWVLSLFRSCLDQIGEVSWVKIYYASVYFIVQWIVCMCLCQGVFSRIGWVHIERQLHYHQACCQIASTFVTLTKERQYYMTILREKGFKVEEFENLSWFKGKSLSCAFLKFVLSNLFQEVTLLEWIHFSWPTRLLYFPNL